MGNETALEDCIRTGDTARKWRGTAQVRNVERRWREHWSSFPLTVGEQDYLKQVGKTVQGQPISNDQLKLIIAGIIHHLRLNEDDTVLDLCCGNGLITQEISKVSRQVVGVDFSRPLVDIARKHHQPQNVRYLNLSVLDLEPDEVKQFGPFTKVYMYEGLQHFGEDSLAKVLVSIKKMCDGSLFALLGSVPDRSKIWSFYNTPKRRLDYFCRTLLGREAIGTWWDKNFMLQISESFGLHCEFLQQHESLYTSHYRFDLLLTSL